MEFGSIGGASFLPGRYAGMFPDSSCCVTGLVLRLCSSLFTCMRLLFRQTVLFASACAPPGCVLRGSCFAFFAGGWLKYLVCMKIENVRKRYCSCLYLCRMLSLVSNLFFDCCLHALLMFSFL